MNKELAIVIINWNSYTLTKETLQSLKNVTFHNCDIVLVDNGSTDDSGEKLCADFSEIIFIKSDINTGFTGGNNIGLEYAIQHGYKYVMMLNNDVEVEPGFIEPLIHLLESNKEVGAVQPLIYFHHNKQVIWNAGAVFNKWIGVPKTLDYNKRDDHHAFCTIRREVDWLTGCAFMISTDVLKKVGLLKNDFFIYYEDVDLSFRIKQAGFKLAYEPSSVIYHIAGMSHKSNVKGKDGFLNPKVHYLNARNRIWLLKQYISVLYLPTVFLYQFFYYLSVAFYFLIRGRIGKLIAWINGTKDGLLLNIYN